MHLISVAEFEVYARNRASLLAGRHLPFFLFCVDSGRQADISFPSSGIKQSEVMNHFLWYARLLSSAE